jgi:hypothetical protein
MYLYETTCHIISGLRTLGEESYDKTLNRHLMKMGNDNWELVSVQKANQILSMSPLSTADLTDEQLDSHASPREVFVFFWKKKVDTQSDSD